MTVLITGKNGQIASCLEEVARELEIDCVALSRQELDLTNIKSIEASLKPIKPSIVVNTAGFTDVEGAEKSDQHTLSVNSTGAGNLALICHQNNIPIIHLSTDYVYDGEQRKPYLETDDTNPVNKYGRSKLAGERLVIANNPRHIILRTAWVYSPFGKNFVKTMLNQAIVKHQVKVVNDQYGCPTYGLDLAEGIFKIIKAIRLHEGDKFPWGIYNMVNEGIASWLSVTYEVYDRSEALNGAVAKIYPVMTVDTIQKVKRPPNTSLNTDKLKNTFNFSLPEWKSGVFQCVTKLMSDQEKT